MSIIEVTSQNLEQFAKLSAMLFPEDDFNELYDLYDKSLQTEKETGFLYEKDNKYVGMMHLSVRSDYVNGTNTSPVVFIEAIYVLDDYRKSGIGKEFIKYAECCARQKGITQVASDCLLDNNLSEQFHKGCGFEEKERTICFVKDIV